MVLTEIWAEVDCSLRLPNQQVLDSLAHATLFNRKLPPRHTLALLLGDPRTTFTFIRWPRLCAMTRTDRYIGGFSCVANSATCLPGLKTPARAGISSRAVSSSIMKTAASNKLRLDGHHRCLSLSRTGGPPSQTRWSNRRASRNLYIPPHHLD